MVLDHRIDLFVQLGRLKNQILISKQFKGLHHLENCCPTFPFRCVELQTEVFFGLNYINQNAFRCLKLKFEQVTNSSWIHVLWTC